MALAETVNHFSWEPEDGSETKWAQIASYAATEDEALHTGALYFMILLTLNGVDHPHYDRIASKMRMEGLELRDDEDQNGIE
jgi:hypothetical protein